MYLSSIQCCIQQQSTPQCCPFFFFPPAATPMFSVCPAVLNLFHRLFSMCVLTPFLNFASTQLQSCVVPPLLSCTMSCIIISYSLQSWGPNIRTWITELSGLDYWWFETIQDLSNFWHWFWTTCYLDNESIRALQLVKLCIKYKQD